MIIHWVIGVASFVGFIVLVALISYGARLEEKVRALEKEKKK